MLKHSIKYYILVLLFAAIAFGLAMLFVGMFGSAVCHIQMHSSKWKVNTEIKLSEEEVKGQDYTIYSRDWHFGKFSDTKYIIITRHRIGSKNEETIANREPFVKSKEVRFYFGPKWFIWDHLYDRGTNMDWVAWLGI